MSACTYCVPGFLVGKEKKYSKSPAANGQPVYFNGILFIFCWTINISSLPFSTFILYINFGLAMQTKKDFGEPLELSHNVNCLCKEKNQTIY